MTVTALLAVYGVPWTVWVALTVAVACATPVTVPGVRLATRPAELVHVA